MQILLFDSRKEDYLFISGFFKSQIDKIIFQTERPEKGKTVFIKDSSITPLKDYAELGELSITNCYKDSDYIILKNPLKSYWSNTYNIHIKKCVSSGSEFYSTRKFPVEEGYSYTEDNFYVCSYLEKKSFVDHLIAGKSKVYTEYAFVSSINGNLNEQTFENIKALIISDIPSNKNIGFTLLLSHKIDGYDIRVLTLLLNNMPNSNDLYESLKNKLGNLSFDRLLYLVETSEGGEDKECGKTYIRGEVGKFFLTHLNEINNKFTGKFKDSCDFKKEIKKYIDTEWK